MEIRRPLLASPDRQRAAAWVSTPRPTLRYNAVDLRCSMRNKNLIYRYQCPDLPDWKKNAGTAPRGSPIRYLITTKRVKDLGER